MEKTEIETKYSGINDNILIKGMNMNDLKNAITDLPDSC